VEKCSKAGEATDDNITRGMRCACWLTKATNTLRISNIIAFIGQQCLREGALVLRYTYISCLVVFLY
jgi:hypothetical protein